MTAAPIRLGAPAADLGEAFDAIRARLALPGAFPPPVEAEAAAAAARGPVLPPGAPPGVADRRDLELVTIDPPGSRDLDQAYFATRRGDGHRVSYAIADVAAFVAPGGSVDAEARARGVTLYLPDRRTPLHPDALGEGAASLLPGEERPALLWTIDLDERADPSAWRIERATVRSRAALSYGEAQRAIESGRAGEPLVLLRDIGRRRERREAERGGVSLNLPAQEIVPAGGGWALRYEAPLAVEAWNAQISLLAGICAARTMIAGGIGLFRAMPAPDEGVLAGLRRIARRLDVEWPRDAGYAEVARRLDPSRPGHAAFMTRAAHRLRGAGYVAWTADSGAVPPAHFAVASLYAHVTAPLRRLADRFANELVLALCRGDRPAPWVVDALPGLPGLMQAAAQREHAAERAAVDVVEYAVLAARIGEVFAATVVDRDERGVTVLLRDPAVVARVPDRSLPLGEEVSLRLRSADPAAGLGFAPA